MNSVEGVRRVLRAREDGQAVGGRRLLARRHGDEKCHDVTLQRLQNLLDRYQHRARDGRSRSGIVSTGFGRLDEALPGGGLPTGSVIEVLSGGSGTGAWTLAFRTASCRLGIADCGHTHSEMCNRQPAMSTAVVVDCDGDFYPPAAMAMGISADRLLIVRARRPADAFWATDQALRCRAVGAVIATRLVVDAARSRRLQLAAEESGGVGLIVAPACTRHHTFAAVQLLVEPVSREPFESRRPSPTLRLGRKTGHPPILGAAIPGMGRRFRITVLKMRGRKLMEPVVVGESDESFDVSVSSVPADRAASDRARRSA